jgi:tetratricopeptide (TPR) repeat protein
MAAGMAFGSWFLLGPAAAAEPAASSLAPPSERPVEPTPAPVPSSAEERLRQAAEHYREAEERYREGDVAGAYERMRGAYERSGRFELLFNLGQLARELGRCPDALRDHRAYLEQAPPGPRRDQVERSVSELERECPERPEPAPPPPRPVPAAPPPTEASSAVRPLRIAGWASVGGALVAGVAATYFALETGRLEDRYEARLRAAREPSPNAKGFSQSDKDLETDGRHAAYWARGLAVGAVGLAAAGITLLVIDHNQHDDHATTELAVDWHGGAARAVYRGSF